MSRVIRLLFALSFVLIAGSGLAAQSASGRLGIGYVFLQAQAGQLSAPANAIELRVLPLSLSDTVSLGVDVRLAEDLSFVTSGQIGDVSASVWLVGSILADQQVRTSFFAGPFMYLAMDPSYGSAIDLGAIVGFGSELFLAQRFSVGFDLGFAVRKASYGFRMGFSAGLAVRYYFL